MEQATHLVGYAPLVAGQLPRFVRIVSTLSVIEYLGRTSPAAMTAPFERSRYPIVFSRNCSRMRAVCALHGPSSKVLSAPRQSDRDVAKARGLRTIEHQVSGGLFTRESFRKFCACSQSHQRYKLYIWQGVSRSFFSGTITTAHATSCTNRRPKA